MEQENKEKETPINPTEQPVESKTAEEVLAEKEAEITALKQKEVELQAQKEHWRGKYERDITSVIPEPAPTEELEVFSDEGKALQTQIKALNEKLVLNEKKESRREAESEFPFLKDMKEEFNDFLEDEENKRLSIKKAARLFAAEKGLLNPEPVRMGLEKPTAGGQQKPEPSFSPDEIRDMMKNDWRRYTKLLKEGKI